MFRHRGRAQATSEVIALGPPLTADLDARLSEALVDGRTLADAARRIRNQREYQDWSDTLLKWRTATTKTLEAGFATTAARDALIEIWLTNAPLCMTWPDLLKSERAKLAAALDFAERVRIASGPQRRTASIFSRSLAGIGVTL